jgi:DNA-binding CsgD family transcriptional regulator/tetratricopeptide (TPR) repeat protein
MTLLERDELLASLQAQLQHAIAGPGRLAFVEGEAGIGKTMLLRAFAHRQSEPLAIHWGSCDALQTPRPLGPLHDIATRSAGELRPLLETNADRLQVFGAFLSMLDTEPSLVLLEDLHWADEATLDLLRYIGRRMSRTRSLVVGSFRSDEVGPGHPLTRVLGDLATSGISRLVPRALSRDAVRTLAGDQPLDVDELHRRTGGNPFFVTEVLAAGGQELPDTVRDAVLARAARLRPSARAVLDAAAVAGPRVEPWLLDELTGAESAAVEECLASGVLYGQGDEYLFRHELGRQAVLGALTPTRLVNLHSMTLEALRAARPPPADLARLAHHAEGSGDAVAVLEYAPAAAREAAADGAHRQAAEQYARALRQPGIAAAQRAELLDDYGYECHLSGLLDDAIEARRAAAKLWRELGHLDRLAVSLSRLAHLLVVSGRNPDGEAVMQEALALVEPGEETPAAVTTRRWAAYVRMLDRDVEEAIREAGMAMALAERLGDQETVMHALNAMGSSLIVSGRVEEGRQKLEQSLALAERAGSDALVSNALGNLGSACGEAYSFELAEDYLRRDIAFATERDMDYSRLYALSWLALVAVYRGRWGEASESAHAVLSSATAPAIARMMALIALGRLRARRGDPGTWEALDEARDLAEQTGTVQRVAPMRAARAEAAWLEGRLPEAGAEAASAASLALEKGLAWFVAELGYWRAQAGERVEFPGYCAGNPFTLEATGQWREAAEAWRALGCPFETARALAAGDEAAQRAALSMLEELGARPMAERVRQALRAAGVRGLRLGPREATRQRPAGLTAKEIAVLELLVQGLRNKEIAQRLHRSPRTIDHHLAAIYAKLGVATRAEAVSAALRLGVVRGA